jgi:phosphocarrier protein
MAERRTLTITNVRGLHARASRKVAEIALRYEAQIVVRRDGEEADARSLMDLMMLGAGIGSEIEVEANGEDAKAALDAIEALVVDKFHEGE